MLHMLLNKPTKRWARDLLAFMRNCTAWREVAYVIERCCERRVTTVLSRRQPQDETFPRRMYEAAKKIIADLYPPSNSNETVPGVNLTSSRPQPRIALELPAELGHSVTHADTCCKWECKKCHLKLSEYFI